MDPEKLLGTNSSSVEALVLSTDIIERSHDIKEIVGNRGTVRKSNLMDKLPNFKIMTGDR